MIGKAKTGICNQPNITATGIPTTSIPINSIPIAYTPATSTTIAAMPRLLFL